jgi:hypothetical protein
MENLDKDPGAAIRTILKAHGTRMHANRGSIFKRSTSLWGLAVGALLIVAGAVIAIQGLRLESPTGPFATDVRLTEISRIFLWTIAAVCAIGGVLGIAAGIMNEWFPGEFGSLDLREIAPDSLLEEIASSDSVPLEVKKTIADELEKSAEVSYGWLLQSSGPHRRALEERRKARELEEKRLSPGFRALTSLK